MDLGITNVFDSAEAYEHLAAVHTGRPKLQVNLNQLQGQGQIFEVGDNWDGGDLQEDDEEEVFDTDVLSNLASFHFDGEGLKNGGEKQGTHFDFGEFLEIGFNEVENSMESLGEGGSVKKLIIRIGNGHKIPDRSRLYFHYAAICEGCPEPFDTSLIYTLPQTVDLRQDILIHGLSTALRSMELCEVARFVIQPEMAFGKLGCPPRIPKNAKVMYIIEMVQYIDEETLNTPSYMTADERNNLPFSEIVDASAKFRTDGNGNYKDGNVDFAVRKWRVAIKMLEDYSITNPEDDRIRCDLLCYLYANLAQGYLKLNRPAQACSACRVGLNSARLKDSVKLLYRFAKAKLMLQDYGAAEGLVRRGLKVEPKNSELKNLLAEIRAGKKQTSHELWYGKYKPPNELRTQENGKLINNETDGPSNSASDNHATSVNGIMKQVEDEGMPTKKFVTVTIVPESDLEIELELDDLVPDYAYCSQEDRKEGVEEEGQFSESDSADKYPLFL